MNSLPEPSATDDLQLASTKAMQGFRERAQRLFESQCARVEELEASISEQLARLDGDDSTSPSTGGSHELDRVTSEELDEARADLAQSRKLLSVRARELKQLRNLIAEQTNGEGGIDIAALLETLSQMRLERDELIERIADAERSVEHSNSTEAEQLSDLQSRFDDASQEVRDLKAKNADLQNGQETPPGDVATGVMSVVASSASFDWEQQKQRMMQELESDLDTTDEQDQETRVSIEKTIRITDQVIAEKDRQIAQLKAQIESGVESDNEVKAANVDFDSDTQIREEREKLASLQDEWREKMRQAEIDISVQRAKLAREHSELEAKLRAAEESAPSEPTGKPATKQTGRWLSRLGLKEDD
jgi:hypothetical protein